MKKEKKILFYSMFNNLLIATLKICGGFIFHLNSLFADGMHTLSDFITDIVSLICSKISNKRPTKFHPFGFGRVSYLSNLFIGVILLILALFIFMNSFLTEFHIPSLKVLYLLLVVLILKFIAIIIMRNVGNKINSILLLTSAEESKTDLYSTLGVIIVTVVLQFSNFIPLLKYSDLIGTIFISFLILKLGIKIVKENALSIIGEVEKNNELELKVSDLLSNFRGIKDKKMEFIKYGIYYRLNLIIELDNNLKLKDIVKLQKKIKQKIIRHYSLKIKYVNINVTNEI